MSDDKTTFSLSKNFFWLVITLITLPIAIIGISYGAIIGAHIADQYISESTTTNLGGEMLNTYISSIMIWGILIILTLTGIDQIESILNQSANNDIRRSNQIGVIISLVMIVLLFKQPYLDELFNQYTPQGVLKIILMGGSIGAGWIVWFVKQIRKYGEFLHIILLGSALGFSWYAKLTAPEPVQTTAFCFIIGSLFRIATDYIDKSRVNP